MNIFTNPHMTLQRFSSVLEDHPNGFPLLCQLTTTLGIDAPVCKLHRDMFPWHWNDTARSFTSLEVDGKFGYRKSMVRRFKVDQEANMRNKGYVVSMWNPATDNSQPTGLKPCLLTMKLIERDNGQIDLCVTFRSRDMLRRMIPNWFQLLEILKRMAKDKRRTPGYLYDFSYEAFWREDDLKGWNTKCQLLRLQQKKKDSIAHS